jgi:hypothetical protein
MRFSLYVAASLLSIACVAQTPGQRTDPPGLTRATGTDASSGIEYSLITVDGKLIEHPGAAPGEAPVPPPHLTAQCTRDKAGKMKFELRANLGGVTEMKFYPPWKPASPNDFAPILDKVQVTMDFLGYKKVTPVRRQWVRLHELHDELEYATPGMGSANMEEVRFYLQFLKALPTLRLTVPGPGTSVVEFETTKWQGMVKQDPLCSAAGL